MACRESSVRAHQHDGENKDRREQQRPCHQEARRRVREPVLGVRGGRHLLGRCRLHALRVLLGHEGSMSGYQGLRREEDHDGLTPLSFRDD